MLHKGSPQSLGPLHCVNPQWYIWWACMPYLFAISLGPLGMICVY